jgi:hypothetical protein
MWDPAAHDSRHLPRLVIALLDDNLAVGAQILMLDAELKSGRTVVVTSVSMKSSFLSLPVLYVPRRAQWILYGGGTCWLIGERLRKHHI